MGSLTSWRCAEFCPPRRLHCTVLAPATAPARAVVVACRWTRAMRSWGGMSATRVIQPRRAQNPWGSARIAEQGAGPFDCDTRESSCVRAADDSTTVCISKIRSCGHASSTQARRHRPNGHADAKCSREKGFFIGAPGADGNFNEDTLRALNTFQDNDALPVQPLCDQACWKALGLP